MNKVVSNECRNAFSESLSYKGLQKLINECVDKCLKKYLQDKASLNEAGRAKETDKKFDEWKNIFDSYLMEMVSELQTDYLDRLGLVVKINPKYIFNGGKARWLASYERRSRQILNGIISIGINYPLLYSEMCRMNVDEDRFNIEAQARITVGHEIGHGLVDYIKNLKLEQGVLSQMPNVVTIRRCGRSEEEILVEEFGEYQFPEATGRWGCILCGALEELNHEI